MKRLMTALALCAVGATLVGFLVWTRSRDVVFEAMAPPSDKP